MRTPGGPRFPAVDTEGAIASAFGLGNARGPLRLAAEGWLGHNRVYRLDAAHSSFAVKRYGRPVDDEAPPEGGFAIELAAYDGGVPMPRPIAAVDGQCWALIGRHWYRCHEWVDGQPGPTRTPPPPTLKPWAGWSPTSTAWRCPHLHRSRRARPFPAVGSRVGLQRAPARLHGLRGATEPADARDLPLRSRDHRGKPVHTPHPGRFERSYAHGMDGANYGWFQAKLHVAAKSIFDSGGMKATARVWDLLVDEPSSRNITDTLEHHLGPAAVHLLRELGSSDPQPSAGQQPTVAPLA